MKIIKSKNFWKAVIITVVLIGIVIGFTWYINNLQNQLENVMVEKESIEVKMDEILKDLEHNFLHRPTRI
jgi:flagellar biosynthesis protein FlhB